MNKDIEVLWLKVHAPIFIPYGVGNYKETIDASPTGPDKSLKMYLQDTGVLLMTKGQRVFIPLPAISHMVLAKV